MSYRLGINTGFAVNRYSEPEEWVRIVGDELGLRYVQFTADMLNPALPKSVKQSNIKRINSACEKYKVQICSTFTGAFTRVNHLAHPDIEVRQYWIQWFKDFIDITVALGARSMGSHFGIFTAADNNDPQKKQLRRQQNIDAWHEVADYGLNAGLDCLTWEPMSISREQGETIIECGKLQKDVNFNSALPFKLCLDVDHGDLCSGDPNDIDPYVWLRTFGKETLMIHLKQVTTNKNGHWPFLDEYNNLGKITPERVIGTLDSIGIKDMDLILELSFKEREPTDSTVISVLKESVKYWRTYINQ